MALDFDSLVGVEVARSDERGERSEPMRCCSGSASSGGAGWAAVESPWSGRRRDGAERSEPDAVCERAVSRGR